MWAIINEENGDQMWSNANGWVDGLEFDLFTDEEKQRLSLPIGGRWVFMAERTP